MTTDIKHYVSIFASFDTKKAANEFLLEHGIKQSIPKGGPVFSYSAEDESKYRDSHDALVDALKTCLQQMNLEDMLLPENLQLGSAIDVALKALKQAGVE